MRSVSILYPYMIQFSQQFRTLAVTVLQLYPTIRRHNPSHKVRRFLQKPGVFVTNYVWYNQFYVALILHSIESIFLHMFIF